MQKLLNVMTRRHVIRRSLLLGGTMLGGSTLSGLATGFLSGCSGSLTDPTKHVTLDPSSEPGILNYAYALLQLETDFYSRVTTTIYPGMTLSEQSTLTQFSGDTLTARNDLQTNQIPAGRITDVILFRLGQLVDFSDRTNVLTHAQTIEVAAAHALQTLVSLATTAATQTLLAGLTTQAQGRASTIDTWLGTTFMPGTISLSAAMATLAPYYLTTFTVIHG